MATKDQVITAHRKHPDWTAQQIADHIGGGCLSAYVRATARRNGLKLPKAVQTRLTAEQLRKRAAALLERADLIEAQK